MMIVLANGATMVGIWFRAPTNLKMLAESPIGEVGSSRREQVETAERQAILHRNLRIYLKE
jgi:hypothetical protein